MPYTIILSGSNVVSGTNNTQYKYRFPNAITFDKYSSVALISANLYYSWFNVSSSLYNNNVLSYKWFNSSGVVADTFTVTLADGWYDVSSINKYLQAVMYSNGHYLKDASASPVYYVSFDTNSSLYAIQLYVTPMPSTLGTYTKPSGVTWNLPSTATTPQVIISSTNNFKSLIGFKAGTYPSATQASKYSYTSDTTPTMSPASSLLMCCSLCNQPYSSPSNVLYSFNSKDVDFGGMISVEPNSLNYVPVKQGTTNEFTIEFRDQDYNRVVLQDSQMVIMLSLQTKEDYTLGKDL
jgi:hypothetical protein